MISFLKITERAMLRAMWREISGQEEKISDIDVGLGRKRSTEKR